MLTSLHINNLYLIDDLEIEFDKGLNILTGETGAGKSIILGAVGLVLGDKADTSAVRAGFNKGIVDAMFDISNNPDLKDLLIDKGLPLEEDNLLIKREISVDGKSKAYVNMSMTTVSTLREIGEYLVDISGQHQHHSLLKVANHINLLDSYAKLESIINDFKQYWKKYLKKKGKLEELIENEKEKEKRKELAQFAIDEIDDANLEEGEEEELEDELKMLVNHQKLVNSTETSYRLIYEDSKSILSSTEIVIGELEKISSYDINMSRVLEETKEALYKLESVKDYIRSYKDSLEFSPERLDEVNERIDLIRFLKKKYGNNIKEIIEYKEECIKTIENIEKNEEEIKILENELADLEKIISEKARTLSKKRVQNARELEKMIVDELSYLGMEKAQFRVEFRYIEDNDSFLRIKDRGVKIEENGIDRIEFTISPNIGEDLKPLAKIASGGELSRIMLAIKNILINADKIGTIIFDEVDVGIGGETSNKVGNKIKEISKNTMVICITHSPQIASKGDNNYLVEKIVKDNRTISIVKKLNYEVKVKEIARMLGGESISDITIQHAKELIKNCEKGK
jgi:DNA repair protein RecN (Recombination protein N)